VITQNPFNVVISGVGGQGVLLAAASIAEAGLRAQENVYMGEVGPSLQLYAWVLSPAA